MSRVRKPPAARTSPFTSACLVAGACLITSFACAPAPSADAPPQRQPQPGTTTAAQTSPSSKPAADARSSPALESEPTALVVVEADPATAPQSTLVPHPRPCSASVDPVAAFDPARSGNTAATSLSPEELKRTMRAMSDRFRACHDAWQTRHPGQSPLDHISPAGDGWPRLKFTIGQKGSVIEAAAKCAPDEVRTCVEAALRSMTFPAPSGGVVTVIYP